MDELKAVLEAVPQEEHRWQPSQWDIDNCPGLDFLRDPKKDGFVKDLEEDPHFLAKVTKAFLKGMALLKGIEATELEDNCG